MLKVCTAAEDDIARLLLYHYLELGEDHPGALVVTPCIRRGPAQACVVRVFNFMRLNGHIDNGDQRGMNTSGSLIEMTELSVVAKLAIMPIRFLSCWPVQMLEYSADLIMFPSCLLHKVSHGFRVLRICSMCRQAYRFIWMADHMP